MAPFCFPASCAHLRTPAHHAKPRWCTFVSFKPLQSPVTWPSCQATFCCHFPLLKDEILIVSYLLCRKLERWNEIHIHRAFGIPLAPLSKYLPLSGYPSSRLLISGGGRGCPLCFQGISTHACPSLTVRSRGNL